MKAFIRKRLPLGYYNRVVEFQALEDEPERGPTGELLMNYTTYATHRCYIANLVAWQKTSDETPGGTAVQDARLQYSQDIWQTIRIGHRIAWEDAGVIRYAEIRSKDNWNGRNQEIRRQCAEVLA